MSVVARISAFLIACGAAIPLKAQAAFDVPRHLAMFDRFCRPALHGLEVFKAVVTVPGATGEQVFAVSPDGHFIDAKTGVEDFLISASFAYGPASVTRFCQVEFLGASPTERTRAATEPLFLKLAPKGDGVTMTGGPIRQELPAIGSFAIPGLGNITSVRSQYTFFGATKPAGSTMSAYIGDNIFLLNAVAIVAR